MRVELHEFLRGAVSLAANPPPGPSETGLLVEPPKGQKDVKDIRPVEAASNGDGTTVVGACDLGDDFELDYVEVGTATGGMVKGAGAGWRSKRGGRGRGGPLLAQPEVPVETMEPVVEQQDDQDYAHMIRLVYEKHKPEKLIELPTLLDKYA